MVRQYRSLAQLQCLSTAKISRYAGSWDHNQLGSDTLYYPNTGVICFYKVGFTPWPRCQKVRYYQIHLHDQVSIEVGNTRCTSWASQAPTTPASCPFPRPRGNAFNLAIGFVGVPWWLCSWLPKPWKLYMCTHFQLKHLKFTNSISSSEFLGSLRVPKSKSVMLVFFLKALQ